MFDYIHSYGRRFMGWVWHPDRRQLTRPVQFGQVNRVPPVGLNPFAGLPRNQRGSPHAFVCRFAQLALNAVTRRTSHLGLMMRLTHNTSSEMSARRAANC